MKTFYELLCLLWFKNNTNNFVVYQSNGNKSFMAKTNAKVGKKWQNFILFYNFNRFHVFFPITARKHRRTNHIANLPCVQIRFRH